MKMIISGLVALAALAGIAGYASAEADAKANGARAPGSCGEYMYWHNGKCMDARNTPSGKSWSDEMLAKKWAG
jgi:hypothetical protein